MGIAFHDANILFSVHFLRVLLITPSLCLCIPWLPLFQRWASFLCRASVCTSMARMPQVKALS